MRHSLNTSMYKRWHPTTIMCFNNNLHCSGCDNEYVCLLSNNASKNVYQMHPVKYATIQTYKNIGKPPITPLNE